MAAGFSEPFTAPFGTEGGVTVEVGVESCDAHIAAKLPECGAAKFAQPKEPEGKAGARLLLLVADSMAEVTVGVRADLKAHTA